MKNIPSLIFSCCALLIFAFSVFSCPRLAIVQGRVMRSIGHDMYIGLNHAQMILSDGEETQIRLTNPFGYYKFDHVPLCGQGYTITAQAKHYQFDFFDFIFPPADDGEDLFIFDFIADAG